MQLRDSDPNEACPSEGGGKALQPTSEGAQVATAVNAADLSWVPMDKITAIGAGVHSSPEARAASVQKHLVQRAVEAQIPNALMGIDVGHLHRQARHWKEFVSLPRGNRPAPPRHAVAAEK